MKRQPKKLAGHRWMLVAAAAAASLGCGASGPTRPAAYPVEAKLTLDGQPFGPALLLLNPVDVKGFSAAGEADQNGNISFTTTKRGDGAPVGEYKVTLPADPLSRAPKQIPVAYQKADSTPLKVKIEAKRNTLQIALDSKAKSASMPGSEMTGRSSKSGPKYPAIDPKLMPKTSP